MRGSLNRPTPVLSEILDRLIPVPVLPPGLLELPFRLISG